MEKAKKKDVKEVVSCLVISSCPSLVFALSLLWLVVVVSDPASCLVFAFSSCCPYLVSVLALWRVFSYRCLRLRLLFCCSFVALLFFLVFALACLCVSCRGEVGRRTFLNLNPITSKLNLQGEKKEEELSSTLTPNL